VDDILFGGTSHSLVVRFAKDMIKEFKMSMMGELQFFLGLQIKQVSGFSTAGSKFLSIVRRARMVSAGDNGIYTGSASEE
jgi:hypothetical protein